MTQPLLLPSGFVDERQELSRWEDDGGCLRVDTHRCYWLFDGLYIRGTMLIFPDGTYTYPTAQGKDQQSGS